MPTLYLTSFNILTATLGAFILLFGLVSYLLKERFYLSEALISLLFGVAMSPHGTGWFNPLKYCLDSEENLDAVNLYYTRLVLGVQLVIAGVQLPSRYLRTEWRSLALLLGPGMIGMWVCASLVVWACVPHLMFVEALTVGACVTPTDPVLSAGIVKGRWAEKHVPRKLQRIIVAESGANDGLGYPFLFLGLYLLRYVVYGSGGRGGRAAEQWFVETWVYTIILSVVYGVVAGWLAKVMLKWAEDRNWVDRESFLVFVIALALFITGTCGMIGSDDVLACFIAGNAFTWDDWFRKETEDDSLQPTIDMLLNLSVFAWFGAVAPWVDFRVNDVIPLWRLVLLGIGILVLRRIPIVLAMHKWIHQIEHWKHAGFVGFFGPIGVSAIFYLYISIDYLRTEFTEDDAMREEAARLEEIMRVVIWFLAICSIVVHGMSIPLGKAGWHLPRTLSMTMSTSDDGSRAPISGRLTQALDRVRRKDPEQKPKNEVFRIGKPTPLQDRDVEVGREQPDEPLTSPSGPSSFQSQATILR
ncbi:Na(+)/H(+) antiporter 2 [Cyphellophora attinorum]|uniref:Na(+)/H(+) antiporter 2 n=1 Tax=Cyphellophora attinorum TaxID=1664694 RepID=A0A0N0NIE0_9EURO|nr:Na(+)/H(+) antiporter 2 [Phialophora attinorum]KPI35731.1 Na(+)/H(+) antiporter 2 [Phialophora attinorum]